MSIQRSTAQTMTDRETLSACIEAARDDLKEQMRDGYDPDEAMHELADGAVPVYNSDLIEVFESDSDLWYAEPETGSDGVDNTIEMMQRVVYDAIYAGLCAARREIEEELEEEREARTCDYCGDEVDRFMGGQAPDEALESLCRDCYTEQGEEAA